MSSYNVCQEMQIVTFLLNGEEYGIDVMKVREIIGMQEVTRTVNAPPRVEGVINLRGAVIPVLSLRRCFGMPDGERSDEQCIAIMHLGSELSGFIIDELSDVIRIRRSDIEPPAALVAQPWVIGTISIDQRIVVIMNIEQLA